MGREVDWTTRAISGVSMLSICTAPGCTTIIFGRGTCVAHERRGETVADSLLTQAVVRAQQAGRPFDPPAPPEPS